MASLDNLSVNLRTLVLSHIEHVKTRQILALSSTFEKAFSLPGALPRTYDFEGVSGDDIVDLVDHLLDAVRAQTLEKVRALELIGDEKNRLCEYACRRNFEVLKWAHHELELPWAPYPAGREGDDILVLRVLRGTWQEGLEEWWPEDEGPEEWDRVTMENGRVVELELQDCDLFGVVPAEVGRLTALRVFGLFNNELTSLPAEIGQLTSLEELELNCNYLTSLPAEIGQLTSLVWLALHDQQLTSVPAEIGQLKWLETFYLDGNQLTSLPAEIGQLKWLETFYLHGNQLTSLPAEIGQLVSLKTLKLYNNQLTSVPAAIHELRASGGDVHMDDGVTVDE